MVRIKVINRKRQEYVRKRKEDLNIIHHNADPVIHPFQRGREYTRALNAVKIESIFAKPLLSVLEGHLDGVYSIEKHPKSIITLVSGSADGQAVIWDMARKKAVLTVNAHERFLRGVTFTRPSGSHFLTCSDDRSIKMWDLHSGNLSAEFEASSAVFDVDGAWNHDGTFAASGRDVSVYDTNRTTPIHKYTFGGSESVVSVRWNPIETHLIGSTGSDRSVVLHDTRTNSPARKVILSHRSNSLSWNPIEPMNFVVASEDGNLYSFDLRNLARARCVHEDHVHPVMDVDFSPTGKEFVSGSYDNTVRIFNIDGSHSREVYHTRRMRKVFAARFSLDAKYVISASDDTNIRIWKSQRSAPLTPLQSREITAIRYRKKLVDRFKHMEEIRRIRRHRHLPRSLYATRLTKQAMLASRRRKQQNIIAHSRGSIEQTPRRQSFIVSEIK